MITQDPQKPVIIYGAGPFAALLRLFLTADAGRTVAAFTINREYLTDPAFCDLPVIPFDSLASQYPPDACDLLLAVGYKRMRSRRTLFDRAAAAGYTLINFIHPAATICAEAQLGRNNIIFPGCVIEPRAALGDNNVCWTGTVIGHDSRIGSHNFMGARTLLGGECAVGDLCFTGIGSMIIDKLTVRDETHLLPGAVLYTDSEPCTKYLGNPAKAFKRHEEEGITIER